MGTDIHMRAEARLREDAPWIPVTGFPNPYYDPIRAASYEEQQRLEGDDSTYVPYFAEPTTVHPYSGRNYTLFGALSDVRNGYGFAGCDLGDPIEPSVAAGRGLPDDLAFHGDPEREEEAKRYNEPFASTEDVEAGKMTNREYAEEMEVFGEHSFGWITLRELLEYDWDRPVVHRGIVGREEHERMAAEGRTEPKDYCGGISGPGIVVVDGIGELPEGYTHVRLQWVKPLRESVSEFIEVVDRLRHWGEDYDLWHSTGGFDNPKSTKHDPDCIRLVFGYDS